MRKYDVIFNAGAFTKLWRLERPNSMFLMFLKFMYYLS